MRFALLGSLLVNDDVGNQVPLGAVRLRVLLAALLLQANLPGSAEALAEAVWDGPAQAGATETLRSYVRRLRRALGPGVETRIEACKPGYLIRVEPMELDILAFEASCRDASTAVRRRTWGEAAVAAARALALWRGVPLLDVRSETLRARFVPRIEQLHIQVLEHHAEANLRLGNSDGLVPELRELSARYPLRERFHAQLMLALVRTGRRAEALEAYRQARRVLVGELGIEPGPELRELQERILRAESSPERLEVAVLDQPDAPASRLSSGPATVQHGAEATAWNALEECLESIAVSGYEEILAELQRRFHDLLNDAIADVIGQLSPGRERLMAATRAYLDECRRRRGIQRLLAGARNEPALRREVTLRNKEFSRLATADFAAMGREPPAQAALLWIIMVAEISSAESAADAVQAHLRAALLAYLPD
jgi:DNA-binding SARP family transcriptional activator